MTVRLLRDGRTPTEPLPRTRATFAPTVRRVQAERLAADDEARRVLDAARAEAAAIVARATTAAAVLADAARTEALDAGRLQALAIVAHARAEEAKLVDAATAIVLQATRALTERALGERLQVDDAALTAWVREALVPLRGARRIVLRGAARTLDRLHPRLRELGPRGCDLVATVVDDALSDGVLHARSELGEVRLEVATQVDALLAIVRDALAGAVRGLHG